MAIDIRLPATETEFEAVYRLRYDVYVAELGYSQRYADHVRRRIVEPMDDSASLLGAFDGSVLVGTLRTNYAKDSCLSKHRGSASQPRIRRSAAHGVADSRHRSFSGDRFAFRANL